MSRRAYVGSSILLEKLLPEEKDAIKEALTYKFEQRIGRKTVTITKKSYKLMRNNVLSLPITRRDLIPKDYAFINAQPDCEVDIPHPKFTLRDSQAQVVDDFVMSGNHFGLVNAVAGFGKSITGLALAHAVQQKTLIVTTTTTIKDMWVGEIKEHFGFDPGVMTGGKYINRDAPICVGNFQTVSKFADETAGEFGLLIIDECHKCVASTFTDIIGKSKAAFRVGLSATLTRTDGMQVMFKDYFGTELYQPPVENVMTPEVWAISLPVQVVGWTQNNARATNLLCADKNYQDMVTNIVTILQELGRVQLVMGKRTNLLEHGYEVVGGELVTGTHNNKSEQRNAIKEQIYSSKLTLVWGSQSIFTEGVSWNPLDTLVMATPISSPVVMEQAVGRVCRMHEGKPQPIIVDLMMDGTYTAVQNRLKFYKKQGIEVRHIEYAYFVKKFKNLIDKQQ